MKEALQRRLTRPGYCQQHKKRLGPGCIMSSGAGDSLGVHDALWPRRVCKCAILVDTLPSHAADSALMKT